MLQLHVAGVFPRTVSELVLLEFASFCKILLLAIRNITTKVVIQR